MSAGRRMPGAVRARPFGPVVQRTGVRIHGVQVHADGQLQVRPEGLFVLQRMLQLSQLPVQRVLQLRW